MSTQTTTESATRLRTRVRRSDPAGPGIRRLRHGSAGFRYVDAAGHPLHDDADRERIEDLVIPPAWTDVWICTDARGHIQAVGTDTAGRRQYLYHPLWRRMRDAAKFDRALELARTLPSARRSVTHDLKQEGFGRDRALAAAFRIIDRAAVRVGGEQYQRLYGSRGVTTLQCRDATVDGSTVTLSFPSKSGQLWESSLTDGVLADYVSQIAGTRRASGRLIAWRDQRWHSVTTAEVNDTIRERTGVEATAKDFRTLRGTLVAARSLARHGLATSDDDADAAVRAAIDAAAHELGNTPTIARDSYIDPRVIDRFRSGELLELRGSPEAAVCALLG